MTNKIILEDGKYTVYHDNGTINVARYSDNDWRNLTGDGLFLAMIHKIESLEEQRRNIINKYVSSIIDSLIEPVESDTNIRYIDLIEQENPELLTKLYKLL